MPAKRRVAVVPAASELHLLLESSRISRRNIRYPRGATLFAQGAAANNVFYLKEGAVKLSVLSSTGKEAVIGMLGPGEFFGEGCLAGQSLRMGTATAIVPSTVQCFPKAEMIRALHETSGFTDQFLAHMLRRNVRIEADLVDQLFNSSEKRLARTLLLLAQYSKDQSAPRPLPKISQETLAEIVGTTRSRVNYFMNKFRRLGLIKYNGGLTINNSLLSVILHD